MSPTAKRWIIRLLKLSIFALLIWGGHKTIAGAYDEFQKNEFDWQRLHYGWLALATLFYLLGQLPMAQFWYQVLRALGQQPGWYQAMRAHLIGHLGKYVPGKALVVVLRVALVRGPRVTTGAAVAATFYETFASMAVGSGLALLVLLPLADWSQLELSSRLFQFDTASKLPAGADPRMALLALGLFFATATPTIPAVFRLLLSKLKAVKNATQRANEVTDQEPITTKTAPPFQVPLQTLLPGFVSLACGWVLMGASLWGTIQGLGVELSLIENLPLLTACAALAIVAGFVSLIPGGAGVREVIFMLILGPLVNYDQLLQVLVPIALRVEWLIGELIVAGILWLIPSREGDHQSAATA